MELLLIGIAVISLCQLGLMIHMSFGILSILEQQRNIHTVTWKFDETGNAINSGLWLSDSPMPVELNCEQPATMCKG